jgi:hypothetical protein
MMDANTRVMPLAILTGIFLLSKPYSNHRKVPKVKREYMERDILDVSLVLIVFSAWGIKEEVVAAAAPRPIKVMMSIPVLGRKVDIYADRSRVETSWG